MFTAELLNSVFCYLSSYGQESSTALLAAASAGHGAIVTILLLARADKNFADKVRHSSRTPENIRIMIDATCDTQPRYFLFRHVTCS